MKKILVVCLLTTLLGALPADADYGETFVTGKEWVERMSAKEKYLSLLPPTLLFSEYEVRLRHPLPEYIYWIDNILYRNPELSQEDIGNIFASTIYLFEPENRPALKSMEVDFLRGDYEPKPRRLPQLTIEQVLEEIPPEKEV